MTSYSPTTLLPPFFLSPPFDRVDHIIMTLWDRHLELELASDENSVSVVQHLEVTAAIIDYWENELTEINRDEIQQRRSNCSKDL